MASYNSEAPLLNTYQAVVSAYSDFLTVVIHTILYERNIYPQTSFIKARKYNYPVRQSRHPKLCKWIMDAVASVEAEMLKCTVAQTSVVIHAPPPSSKPLERYVFSTASFPRIQSSETLTTFASPPASDQSASTEKPPDVPSAATPRPADLKKFNPPPTSDLPEQFRATLARLSTSLTRLNPLPEDCSFTLAIELRDEEVVDAPIGRGDRWVAAEPGLQKERRRDGNDYGGFEGGSGDTEVVEVGLGESKKGKDLGGVRTTPVRALEAGAFRMEVWIEEGRGKFQAQVEEDDEYEYG
ncbi:hypothetical protein HO133_007198 [Letharia lupina]|uniref:HORMA domain-containing protein n=1 Tax=Letharia lupina TaxID=560253 RepID=A0A8H6FIC2_9LECA|nr:uncharacterized protein HO133_007198 [Letharia lupina]KAF6229084.1 hypothetical protein HO133_007198 [Letharia lupina]